MSAEADTQATARSVGGRGAGTEEPAQRARTYGGRDVVVHVGRGDEADEEAALADGRVPDEQDLEGAVVAARRRRGHAANLASSPNRSLDRTAGEAKRSTREWRGRVGWCGAVAERR